MNGVRVFGVDYPFLSCGDVFTQGLATAAKMLGLIYEHEDWSKVELGRLKAFNPDLVFVVHGRNFARRHKHRLSEFPAAVWLLDEPYEVDDTETWSHLYRHVFVCDRQSLPRHPRSSYLPTCYDPGRHTFMAGAERRYRVGFIGGENGTRDAYLGALANRKLLDYAIGGPFGLKIVRDRCPSNNIPAAEVPGWYQQTRMVLNVFRDRHHYNRHRLSATALNPRIYEATGCGALVVSEWRPELAELVPELPTFKSVEECVQLVAHLLENPDEAEQIRQRVQARLSPHTYEARLTQVIHTALKAKAA